MSLWDVYRVQEVSTGAFCVPIQVEHLLGEGLTREEAMHLAYATLEWVRVRERSSLPSSTDTETK